MSLECPSYSIFMVEDGDEAVGFSKVLEKHLPG